MFRATLHTSFIENGIVRLSREDLDGGSLMDEDVYPKDFFIDLIFTDARTDQNLKKGNKGKEK